MKDAKMKTNVERVNLAPSDHATRHPSPVTPAIKPKPAQFKAIQGNSK
jgi:hypothetical protein